NYFQLVDDKGDLFKPRFASVSLPVTRRAQDVAAGLERQYYSEARVGGEHLRIFTLPLPRGPAPPGETTPRLAVQVVSSLSGLDSELGKIKLWLALVALGGIAIASAVGFVVARAALRPLRRLSETAEHVRATRDLTRRIDVSGNDELSRLATTFNSMLASLDE